MATLRTACLVLVPAVTLSGCAAFSPRDVASPTSITLETAMGDVGRGFSKMKEQLGTNKLGLIACTVEVNFNVTAKANQGGELVLDANLKPPAQVLDASLGVTATQTNTSEGSRGNTVAITLTNIACLPDKAMGAVDPKKIGEVHREIESIGGEVFGGDVPGGQ